MNHAAGRSLAFLSPSPHTSMFRFALPTRPSQAGKGFSVCTGSCLKGAANGVGWRGPAGGRSPGRPDKSALRCACPPRALLPPSSRPSAAGTSNHSTSNHTLTLTLLQVKVDDVAAVYTLGDELGRGRFSVVQAATHKQEGSRYAVKVVENSSLDDEENLEALETEIKILRQLSHPHIVQLKEVRTQP
eukprot:scaffold15679_cov66-Phaeocystis_antarctica.AAC.7